MNAHTPTPLRILSALFAMLLLCLLLVPSVTALESGEEPELGEVSAALLYHLATGEVVLSKEADTNLGAGSTVKVMSGLLFCEKLGAALNQEILITKDMMEAVPSQPGRALGLSEGDILRTEALLYAAICGSYNDAFYLLAAYISGSTEDFVALMNARAQELGALSTSYTDPTGIRSGSRTTAEELLQVTRAAYENALFMELSGSASYHFQSLNLDRQIYNRNALISTKETPRYFNRYCKGMSAGSTSADGNCVVTSAEKNGEVYLSIVLGGQESDSLSYGYEVTNRMLNWVYKTYSYIEVVAAGSEICTLPVTVSDMTTEVPVTTDQSLSAYLPLGVTVGEEITYSIRLTVTSLEAPVTEGQFVGYLAVIYRDRVLGTVNLYTAGSAERSSLISSLKGIQALTQNRALVAGCLFFVVAISAWVATELIIRYRRRHKWDKYFSDRDGEL